MTNSSNQRDEDLAIKPTSPIVERALGLFFLALLARLIWEFRTDQELGVLFLCCFVATVLFSKGIAFIARKLGQILSNCRRGQHIPADCRHPLRTPLKQRKFADQAWQLAIHVSMACFELYLLNGTTWYTNPATCFSPCPLTFTPSTELRFFYVLQLAIWVWTGFSCKWIESRRKDYVEMMLHHCVTVGLILGSFLNGEHAIGLVVLFVHDTSDVALDLMKMFNYLKLEDQHGWYITEVSFVANLCTWIYFRLYVFPVHVLYYGSWHGYAAQCGEEGIEGVFARCQSAGSCLQSDIGLAVLCVLHVFWFYILLRVAYKLIGNTSASQIGREEYEGESGDSGADEGSDVKKER